MVGGNFAGGEELGENHMAMTPLQRLTHQPVLTADLKQRKWSRLERRASSLMMAALPEQLKEEVVAAKSVSALGILSKAMLLYQPGGLAERTAILSALESPQEATTISMAITQLRRWVRWKRRAVEVGVSLPDSTILIRGLAKLMKRVVASYPDLSLRLSVARNSLLIDTVPNHESVSQYSEHLLAELEQMGHQSKKKEALQNDPPPKVRKFDEGGEKEDKGRPKGRLQEEFESKRAPCKYFLSDQGCRRGRQCPFGHMMDQEKRC